MSAPTATARYRVACEYLTARSASSGFSLGDRRSVQIFGYHRGQLLPADVPAEDIARWLRKGLVEEVVTDAA